MTWAIVKVSFEEIQFGTAKPHPKNSEVTSALNQIQRLSNSFSLDQITPRQNHT